jgi:tetratricopeptide (TPR) repeat protein
MNEIIFHKGDLYMQTGKQGNKTYQKALEHYSRGNCKKLLKDLKGAILEFNKAIEFNPKFAEAYYKRGNTKLLLDDISGAEIDYNRAIELNPKLAEAFNNRAMLKHTNGDEEGSRSDFYKAGQLGFVNAYHIHKEFCR